MKEIIFCFSLFVSCQAPGEPLPIPYSDWSDIETPYVFDFDFSFKGDAAASGSGSVYVINDELTIVRYKYLIRPWLDSMAFYYGVSPGPPTIVVNFEEIVEYWYAIPKEVQDSHEYSYLSVYSLDGESEIFPHLMGAISVPRSGMKLDLKSQFDGISFWNASTQVDGLETLRYDEQLTRPIYNYTGIRLDYSYNGEGVYSSAIYNVRQVQLPLAFDVDLKLSDNKAWIDGKEVTYYINKRGVLQVADKK